MNVFELTAIVTPLGGAISAGRVAAASGFWPCVLFSLGGLVLGIAIYFVAIGLSAGVCKLVELDTRQEGKLSSLGGLLALSFVMAAPVFAIFASTILVPLLRR
jgi:hypothetical protein